MSAVGSELHLHWQHCLAISTQGVKHIRMFNTLNFPCTRQCPPFLASLQVAGEATTFMIVAKDFHGVQKSLGGDRFAVSWCHNGTKAYTTGMLFVYSSTCCAFEA